LLKESQGAQELERQYTHILAHAVRATRLLLLLVLVLVLPAIALVVPSPQSVHFNLTT